MEKRISIAPSVLSADFSDICGGLRDIRNSGAPIVHLDVMDGLFVPNITFGPKFIKDIRKHSALYFDTHLMIADPKRYVMQFAEAGSDCITFHVEACSGDADVRETIEAIHKTGKGCGISIKPATPVSAIEPYLDDMDIVLIMSVEPGFGGQGLIPETLDKVRELASIRGDRKYRISIDGGVNLGTIGSVFSAGVDIAVAGSAFFSAADKAAFVSAMSVGGSV